MPYQAEYIWIDGTEPSPLLRSKTKIVADGKEPRHLGLRRLEHQPGHSATTPTACCGRSSLSRTRCAAPDDKLVMCEVLN